VLTAQLGGTIHVQGAIDVAAESEGSAKTDAVGIAIGLAGIGAMDTESTMSPTLIAALTGGSITASSVSVRSVHNFGNGKKSESKTIAATGGVVGVSVNNAKATASANLDSYIAGDVQVTAPNGVTISASGTNTAIARTTGANVGLIAAVGGTDATSTANGVAKAGIRDSAALSATPAYVIGSLDISAFSQDTANTNVTTASGGFVDVADNDATANAKPVVEAYVGMNTSILSSGNVSVSALAKPEGDARTSGKSIGGVSIGASQAKVDVQPTVTATVKSASVIDAAGNVTVKAEALPQSGTVPDYKVTAANDGNDTITVATHGLETGDIVEYFADGTPITGLSGLVQETRIDAGGNVVNVNVNRTYGVITIDQNTIAFGNEFAGDKVDSDTEIIEFDGAHNFVSGDQVRYYVSPGTATGLGGANTATTYWVLVVDDRRIKLVDSQDKALNPQNYFESFLPTDVTGGTTINLGTGHGLQLFDGK